MFKKVFGKNSSQKNNKSSSSNNNNNNSSPIEVSLLTNSSENNNQNNQLNNNNQKQEKERDHDENEDQEQVGLDEIFKLDSIPHSFTTYLQNELKQQKKFDNDDVVLDSLIEVSFQIFINFLVYSLFVFFKKKKNT